MGWSVSTLEAYVAIMAISSSKGPGHQVVLCGIGLRALGIYCVRRRRIENVHVLPAPRIKWGRMDCATVVNVVEPIGFRQISADRRKCAGIVTIRQFVVTECVSDAAQLTADTVAWRGRECCPHPREHNEPDNRRADTYCCHRSDKGPECHAYASSGHKTSLQERPTASSDSVRRDHHVKIVVIVSTV
jgi:hypothetical protein